MKSVKIVLVVLLLAGLAPVVALAQSNDIGEDQDPVFDGAVVTDTFGNVIFPIRSGATKSTARTRRR
jgi:hypothetical protein